MGDLAGHFEWLVSRSPAPVVYFIDDLDRCDQVFVVDLLNAIQTLVRQARLASHLRDQVLFFVVAADGRWIRRSYEIRHELYVERVSEPGRPLGYLFLEKLFQLTVPVPLLSAQQRRQFLASLLAPTPETHVGTVSSGETLRVSDADVQKLIQTGQSEQDLDDALTLATEDQRSRLGGLAAEQLARPRFSAELEHSLQRYAPMLEPNPRSMKRFVLAYSINKSLRLAEGTLIDRDALARWTILSTRWPALADHVVRHLDDVRPQPDGFPVELRDLVGEQSVRHVVGGVLDAEAIRACTGLSAAVAEDPVEAIDASERVGS